MQVGPPRRGPPPRTIKRPPIWRAAHQIPPRKFFANTIKSGLALAFRLRQLHAAVGAVAGTHRRQRAAAARTPRRQPRPALRTVLPVLRVLRLALLALHHEPLHKLQPTQKLLLRRPPLSPPPSPRPPSSHVRHPCLTPLPSGGTRRSERRARPEDRPSTAAAASPPP
jgi:hypothetical protein